jgi:hypothetical protein
MTSVQYLTKSYPLITIVNLANLGKQDQENVINHLKTKHNAWPVAYPSAYAKEISEELSKKGFHKFKERFPYHLTTDEAVMLFMRSLDRFNPQAVLRSTPNTLRVIKSVSSDRDLARVVDDLLLQQDNITLTCIFKLANETNRVAFVTSAHPINERLCRQVITLSDEYIGKRKFEEKMGELDALVDAAKEADKLNSQEDQNEGKYRHF